MERWRQAASVMHRVSTTSCSKVAVGTFICAGIIKIFGATGVAFSTLVTPSVFGEFHFY
jgi:hypothetical protein